jgi:hypothetical protein
VRRILLVCLAIGLLTSTPLPAHADINYNTVVYKNESDTSCYNFQLTMVPVKSYIITKQENLLSPHRSIVLGNANPPNIIIRIGYCRISKDRCQKPCTNFTTAWEIGDRSFTPTRLFHVNVSDHDSVNVKIVHD